MTARGRLIAGAIAVATALAGCASIPTAGGVQVGTAPADQVEQAFPIPGGGPPPGASPTAVVAGFIDENAAGVAGDFTYAYQHMSVQAARDWDPFARAFVFGSGEVNVEWDPGSNLLYYTFPVAAYVDAEGRMTEAAPGKRETLEFIVTQSAALQGEWRISGLADGVVLSEASFAAVYREVGLAFSTPDGEVVVYEQRWLPTSAIETDAALALIGGPSEWLADAVETGIPVGTTLSIESVPIADGEAQVTLDAPGLGAPDQRGLVTRQFEETLEQLPGVRAVDVEEATLGLIGGNADFALDAAPVPHPNALVIVNGQLGVWDGVDVRVLGPEDGGAPPGTTAAAVTYSGDRAALLANGGVIVVDGVSGASVPLEESLAPAGLAQATVAARGTSLVAPSFDRHGWVWTGEAQNAGVLAVVSPTGERSEVEVPWLVGRELVGLKVARDGARVAVLSTIGGQVFLDVAGVVRADEGEPVSVSATTLATGTPVESGVALAWVDDQTLAVLGAADEGAAPPVYLIDVGGRTVTIVAVPGAVGIAARHGENSLVVVTADGTLHQRTVSGWSAVLAGGEGPVAFATIAYGG